MTRTRQLHVATYPVKLGLDLDTILEPRVRELKLGALGLEDLTQQAPDPS